jgi:hypothetical protein
MTKSACKQVQEILELSAFPLTIIEITRCIRLVYGTQHSVNSIGTRVTDERLRKSLRSKGYAVKSRRIAYNKPEHVYSLERI